MAHAIQNDQQLPSTSFSLQSRLDQNTEVVSDSQKQNQPLFDNEDNADVSMYLLAIATVSRDLLYGSELSRSHNKHQNALNTNIVVVDGIDRLSVLLTLGVEHEVLLRDGFSETQHWGGLHYFYVKVAGSQTLANGVGALLGTLFRQDAIGITHLPASDDFRRLKSEQGQPLPEGFHPYFLVHSISPISRETSIDIMKRVCQCFSDISAQLDTSGKFIEFHDFSSSSCCTKDDVTKLLNENFHQPFQIEAGFAKSQLLNKNDYEQLLAKWGLEMSRPIDWKELISKHKVIY